MKNKKVALIVSILLILLSITFTGCNSREQNKAMLRNIANKHLPEVQADGYLSSVTKAEIEQDILNKKIDNIDEDDMSIVKITGSKKGENTNKVFIRILIDHGVAGALTDDDSILVTVTGKNHNR